MDFTWLAFLAQATPPSGGGLSPLTQILVAVAGGGVAVALIDWYRNRGKDRAMETLTQAQTEQISVQSKTIAEELNETIWERTQLELAKADKNLEAEREARRAVERRAEHLEHELEELNQRLRHMEQQAHEERSIVYNALLEAIPDAVIQAGHYGLIKSVNEAAVKMFGYDRDDLLGQPIVILMPERYRKPHIEGFTKSLKTGKGPILDSDAPVRVTALHADGHEFQIALRLSQHGQCFTAVIRPYYPSRNGGELTLVEYDK